MERARQDEAPAPPSAFIVVRDIAAPWTAYDPRQFGLIPGPAPGLLLHAAGPTDEGFRTIDLWLSDAAYEHHRSTHGEHVPAGIAVPPVVRTLHVRAGWHADSFIGHPMRPPRQDG